MKTYLNGFHLSFETWQGGRDKEGWKVPAKAMQAGVIKKEGPAAMSNVKPSLHTQTAAGWDMFLLQAPQLDSYYQPPGSGRTSRCCCLWRKGNNRPSAASGASVPPRPSTALVTCSPWDSVQPSSDPIKCVAALACGEGMRRDLAPTTGDCKIWCKQWRKRQPLATWPMENYEYSPITQWPRAVSFGVGHHQSSYTN